MKENNNMKVKNNKFITLLLIAGLVLVVFAIISKFRNENLTQNSVSKDQDSVDTASWKIYKNVKLGYSFKYPDTLEVMSDNSSGVTFGIKDHLTKELTPQIKINSQYTMEFSKIEHCLQAGNVFPCFTDGRGESKPSTIKIGNKTAESAYITTDVYSNFKVVQLSSPRLEIVATVNSNGANMVFNEILSTFEFTN